MPDTIDTAALAAEYACADLRDEIHQFATFNHITHLISTRVLDPLGIVDLKTADSGQLKAVLHCLFLLAVTRC